MQMNKKRIYLFLLITCLPLLTRAQNYHAVQGSSETGSLAVHNNPAAIVNSPSRWDLTLFGLQSKISTNVIQIENYSLFKSPANSQYYFRGAAVNKYGYSISNLNLFNARIALGPKRAIAFGANLRNYVKLRTDPYAYADTMRTIGQFLNSNRQLQPLNGSLENSGWAEIYASYAQTVFDDGYRRLNAGISLRLNRGLSGAHISLNNARFSPLGADPEAGFQLLNASARYGYSSNYDRWKSNLSTTENMKNFATYTEGGASFDLGVEYLIRSPAAPLAFADDDEQDYEWKLGLSLLDIGLSRYKYGVQSRLGSGLQAGLTDISLHQKLDSTVSGLAIFNDSLATILQNFRQLQGKFQVLHPARLVINIDRYISGSWFINADLSINLSGISGKKRLYVSDINLITITPRWETQKLGVYLPISLNTQKQLWVGTAIKAGPLLIGLHNIGYLLTQKSLPRGGGYLAIILKPGGSSNQKNNRGIDCPVL